MQNGVNGEGAEGAEDAALADVTNTVDADEAAKDDKQVGAKPQSRPRKQRGPPEDGIPSKTKVMVANLPYDLDEQKVCLIIRPVLSWNNILMKLHYS